MTTPPKPPLPYCVGQKLVLLSHQPPPPIPRPNFRVGSSKPRPVEEARAEEDWIIYGDPVQKCLDNPPVPGVDGEDRVTVQVTQELQVEEDKNSQIALVKVIDSSSLQHPDTEIVAKFYDPLYQDLQMPTGRGVDADFCYSHECAAYQRLVDLQGSFIPQFYGSFTLEIPVGDGHSRRARLILMQYIPGSAMSRLDPNQFSKEDRQSIIKQAVDIEAAMYNRHVQNIDYYTRNIMIIPSQSLGKAPKVVVIDLGRVRFQRMFPDRYISPLLCWNVHFISHAGFQEWIDWEWQPWLGETYEETKGTITGELKDFFLRRK